MSFTWTALPDVGNINTSTPGVLANSNAGHNACLSDAYSYTDNARFSLSPESGASTPLTVSSAVLFEVRLRVRRIQMGSRFSTDGNLYVGLTRNLTGNINQWDYCLNVSTAARRIGQFPHPGNSVLLFEFNSFNPFAPRPVYWDHGIWASTDQLIRLQGINGTLRYLIDNKLIYTSPTPIISGQALFLAALFDCHFQELFDLEVLTGSNVLVAGDVTVGPNVGQECAGSFPVPGGATLPAGVAAIQAAVNQMPALPQGEEAPIPTRFQETAVNWGEFEQRFGTGFGQANTLQNNPIRRFEIDWDGLSPDQAAVLDAHYERSHAGIPFTITNPHTGEVITNCRYASYTRGDHVRYWIQSRAAVIVRYV